MADPQSQKPVDTSDQATNTPNIGLKPDDHFRLISQRLEKIEKLQDKQANPPQFTHGDMAQLIALLVGLALAVLGGLNLNGHIDGVEKRLDGRADSLETRITTQLEGVKSQLTGIDERLSRSEGRRSR